MQQLLADVGAPTYGGKEVLVQRILMLLQEAQHQQPAEGLPHHQQQQQVKSQGSVQGQWHQEGIVAAAAAVLSAPAARAAVHPRSVEVWSSSLARQQLLDEVVDPHEIAHWLMEARAADVAIIDVR